MTEIPEHLCAREDCPGRTHGVLCDTCRQETITALGDLPILYRQLSLQLPPGSTAMEHVSGSQDPPLPLRESYLSLMAFTLGTLEDIEDGVRHNEAYTSRPERGRWDNRVTQSAWWLRQHIDQLEHHPEGPVLCDELRSLKWQAVAHLQLTNPPDRLDAPCPACDTLGLIRHQGSSTVQCTYTPCGRRWTENDYQKLVYMLAWSINAQTAAAWQEALAWIVSCRVFVTRLDRQAENPLPQQEAS